MSEEIRWYNEKGEQPEWRTWPLDGISDSYRLGHKFSHALTVDIAGGTIEPVDSKYGVFIYSGVTSAIISSAMNTSGAVLSGGAMTMNVYNKGSALDTTVLINTMRIFTGGYASGVVFSSYTFTVRSGGFVEDVVMSAGSAFISGAATSITHNDGTVLVAGGTISGYSHNSVHEDLLIIDGGIVVDMTQTKNCGTTVSGGGVLSNAHISSGGLKVSSGGTATVVEATAGGVNVYDGGMLCSGALRNTVKLIVFAGGSASGIVVFSAGSATISSGGIATDVTQSGGYLYVSNGGVVSNAVGGPRVLDGGSVVDLTVASKNTARVFAGGSLATATVDNGGILHVSGGVASDVVVLSGGTIMVSSGASAVNVTSNAGAKVDSKAGAYITYKTN